MNGFVIVFSVITSYSIHYTKLYEVKPIEKLMEAAEKLKILFKHKKAVVTIVGGGPSSAEVAGNIWQLAKRTKQHMPEIKILAGSRFMARFPESVRGRVTSILEKRGIRIFENRITSYNVCYTKLLRSQ